MPGHQTPLNQDILQDIFAYLTVDGRTSWRRDLASSLCLLCPCPSVCPHLCGEGFSTCSCEVHHDTYLCPCPCRVRRAPSCGPVDDSLAGRTYRWTCTTKSWRRRCSGMAARATRNVWREGARCSSGGH